MADGRGEENTLAEVNLDELSRAEEGRPVITVSEDTSKFDKGPDKQVIKFLLWDISDLSENMQFSVLACGVFVFFLLCSYLEEFLFKIIPEFKYGWYLTFFELTCFAGFAMMERSSGGEEPMARSAPLRGHFWVSAAMTASRGLTNVSLQYLAYPTQVVFKSMKLITVMMASVVFLGKRYVGMEYLAAAMLVASAALFSLGDVDLAPDYNPYGVFIVCVSLFCDAMHSTTQEKLLKDLKTPMSEVMVYTNLFAAGMALAVNVANGELWPALAFCQENPMAYAVFTARAVVVYCGVLCFVALIKAFGGVLAVTVTTIRKILSIVLSFILFPKPLTAKYGYGLVLFIGAVFLNLKVKQLKSGGQR